MTITVFFLAEKSTSVYLWLFVAILRLGLAQDAPNNSQTKGLHLETRGPEYILLRQGSSNVVTNSCSAPPQPANGDWKLHRDDCEGNMDCTVPEGTSLPPGTQLIYRCNSRYKLNENSVVFCRSKGTWSALPVCNEVKCGSLRSESTTATCTSPSGDWVNCDSPVPSGTQADITCSSGYAKEMSFTTRKADVVCSANGAWEPEPIKCVPVCGQATTRVRPLTIDGVTANVTDNQFPWHASLHMQKIVRKENTTVLEYVCSATIISTNFLLTAAHCVYDEETQTTHDPRKFYVITGNIFRDYDPSVENVDGVRKARVKRVYTYCTYNGLAGNYAADIALIELQQPFELSSILQPACLDHSDNSQRILESGVEGRISGFGKTGSKMSSSILQTITVPYVSFKECVESEYPAQNDLLITNDKFCAGFKNGSVVCDGDSGSGWVIERGGRWHLMGILSIGLAVNTSNGIRACDKDSYSLYIKVSTYIPWIKDVLCHAENNKSYPTCRKRPSYCSAPPQPTNGEWRLHRDSCGGDIDCKVSEGTLLKEHSQLNYSCATGFEVKGSIYVTCRWDGQWTPIPNCIPVSQLESIVSSSTNTSVITTTPLPDATEDLVGGQIGAIARQKCKAYSQYVYDLRCPPVATDNGLSVFVSEKTGKRKTQPMEFPPMVAIGFGTNLSNITWGCGGTLISENFVITVAHCTSSPDHGIAGWVRVGDLDLVRSDDGATPEERRITERIRHPKYNSPAQYYDIALLRLETRVPFNGWIRPACLHTTPYTETDRAVATGWGKFDWSDESQPNDLHKVTVPIVNSQTCVKNRDFRDLDRVKFPHGIFGDWMICAGSTGRDTCMGDSGGPLFIPSQQKYHCMFELIGMTSWGGVCGNGIPAIYTRVYPYISWIEATVWGTG